MSNFLTGLVDMPVNAVQNLSQPASDRFTFNYNLPSRIQTPAILDLDVDLPAGSSRSVGTQNDNWMSTSTLSSGATTQSQVGTPSMVLKRNPLQKAAANASYMARRVLNWGIEVPMGLALMFSQGLHNTPRLYHDRTVRDTPEVTGFKSGFVAAGKVGDICILWNLISADHPRNLDIAHMMESPA